MIMRQSRERGVIRLIWLCLLLAHRYFISAIACANFFAKAASQSTCKLLVLEDTVPDAFHGWADDIKDSSEPG